MLEGSKIPC